MITELGPNARMVTFTGEGHGQFQASTCVAKIEGALLADLTLPKPDTVCEPDPVLAKPDWWDALPCPTACRTSSIFLPWQTPWGQGRHRSSARCARPR